MSRPSPAKATVPTTHGGQRRAPRLPAGRPAEGDGHGHQHHHLHDLDQPGSPAILAASSAGPAERRGAQPLQHAVRALEPGGDAEAHHRGRHHGQGQDARGEEVDRAPPSRSGSTSTSEKNTSSSTGMPSVSSSDSPRRSVSQLTRVWASGRHASAGAGPAGGRDGGVGAVAGGRSAGEARGTRPRGRRRPARRSARGRSCSASQAVSAATTAGLGPASTDVLAGRRPRAPARRAWAPSAATSSPAARRSGSPSGRRAAAQLGRRARRPPPGRGRRSRPGRPAARPRRARGW